MDNRPIGFLDSGVGAVGVWSATRALLPRESTVLLADGGCFPYGALAPEALRERTARMAGLLVELGVKLAVVACNTASVHALAHLRQTFPELPFVGVVPVVKTLAQETRTGTIAILATPATADSAYLSGLVRDFAPDKRLVIVACPGLAELVEAGAIDAPETDDAVARYLEPVRASDADVLGLACTHYVFLREAIERALAVRVYEPSLPVARRTRAVLEERAALSDGGPASHQFLTTGDLIRFTAVVRGLLRRHGDDTGGIAFGRA